MKKILIVAICMLLTTGCSGSKEPVKEGNTTQEKTQNLVEKNKLKEELKEELKQEQEEQNQQEKEQQEEMAEINNSPKVDARPKNESLGGCVSEETKQQWYDKLYQASHTDDFEGAYDKADYVLNEVWKVIKENSNNYTYNQLLTKQKEWIAKKEKMSFNDQVNETINRCYYLINAYL